MLMPNRVRLLWVESRFWRTYMPCPLWRTSLLQAIGARPFADALWRRLLAKIVCFKITPFKTRERYCEDSAKVMQIFLQSRRQRKLAELDV